MTDPRIEALTPMLPSKRREPFDSKDWIFELKWGGVRTLAFIEGGKVTLRGQNQMDLTGGYPELQGMAEQLDGHQAVLDGEIVALGPKGRPNLELFRPRLGEILRRSPPSQVLPIRQAQGKLSAQHDKLPRAAVCYEVTDLLAFDGQLLTDLPLWARKNLLHARFKPTPVAQVSDFIEEEGTAFFDAVCELELEGMVAKEKQAAYTPGKRTRHWLEVPALGVGHFVIGGYTFGGGQKKAPFESLLLGAYQGKALRYAGRATASLSNPEGWRTVELLERLHTSDCPFSEAPPLNRFSYWCRPEIACQIRTGERGPGGELRFGLFVCLRPDLSPEDCVWEQT